MLLADSEDRWYDGIDVNTIAARRITHFVCGYIYVCVCVYMCVCVCVHSVQLWEMRLVDMDRWWEHWLAPNWLSLVVKDEIREAFSAVNC